ncbi:YqcI/YcgG family protein [Campylobacter sp. MIT 21-1685]|uniref:YqcI/YcgG family protein n=1 Tax=unclassified Campylobacter TaxID=2593542 RepID=UPI00224AC3C5|nr:MULTISPECIES: YqcI/YcgG family protein [unclassified Campylobacter]MCX2683459.1 YqcI/YcgG family protein [Campylobacter sp. MIT 21-1684]MCX2751719.1 YqcI/YcgG family protein [Campylobacter sp. MIT 21-1682]MCX2807921.1 YqcI/YcgG family protein [Campylobacter sp. MIT 21-1685]
MDKNNHNSFIISLREYANFCKSTPLQERIKSPLVIFFEEKFKNLEEEQNFACQQIQNLHENDNKKWLSHIPKDTSDTQWCFCFEEMEWFLMFLVLIIKS